MSTASTRETRPFRDRRDAGHRLAGRLGHLCDADPIVLGLPRGGVPVAFEVARALPAPLDVVVVRKLGIPFQSELGVGAVGEEAARVLNHDIIRQARLASDELAVVETRERAEVERRVRCYRGSRLMVSLEDRTVIVVDDGIATGATARAALQIVRAHRARRVVLAVPVATPEMVREMTAIADEVIAVETPTPFVAIGEWYRDFTQTTDDEVARLLDAATLLAESRAAARDNPADSPRDEIEIVAGSLRLAGHLTVPGSALGIVVFAHGSGSSRHSPRNQLVARRLNTAGLGTLLFDLLLPDESLDRANVFDVELLAVRLLAATRWLRSRPESHGLPIGYFGASTGAAAALWAAAEDPTIGGVVSRGGRPDLAAPRLRAVRAPTLLIVGGDDTVVLRLNTEASRSLACAHRLDVVSGATHLFEEPGTLETAADLARDWFVEYLSAPTRSPS